MDRAGAKVRLVQIPIPSLGHHRRGLVTSLPRMFGGRESDGCCLFHIRERSVIWHACLCRKRQDVYRCKMRK